MGGTKKLVNNANATLAVSLLVRKGDVPGNRLGVVSVTLAPGQTQSVSYGDASSPYLDGIVATTISGPDTQLTQVTTFLRGSPVDNQLNTHNTITIGKDQDALTLSYKNS